MKNEIKQIHTDFEEIYTIITNISNTVENIPYDNDIIYKIYNIKTSMELLHLCIIHNCSHPNKTLVIDEINTIKKEVYISNLIFDIIQIRHTRLNIENNKNDLDHIELLNNKLFEKISLLIINILIMVNN